MHERWAYQGAKENQLAPVHTCVPSTGGRLECPPLPLKLTSMLTYPCMPSHSCLQPRWSMRGACGGCPWHDTALLLLDLLPCAPASARSACAPAAERASNHRWQASGLGGRPTTSCCPLKQLLKLHFCIPLQDQHQPHLLSGANQRHSFVSDEGLQPIHQQRSPLIQDEGQLHPLLPKEVGHCSGAMSAPHLFIMPKRQVQRPFRLEPARTACK